MLSLSACSNEELHAIIISASGELARRAQTMGSLPMTHGAPQGWPQQQPSGLGQPFFGWPQPPAGWHQQPAPVAAATYPPIPSQPPSWQVNGTGAPAVASAPPIPAVPAPDPLTTRQPQAPDTFPQAAPAPSSPQPAQAATNGIAPLPTRNEDAPTAASAAPAPGGHGAASEAGFDYGDPLINSLVLIYQEATEYPVELLDPKVDLEADLGIDSVKQMQVLGMIKERHGFDLPEDMDMKAMRTISEVADSVRHLVPSA